MAAAAPSLTLLLAPHLEAVDARFKAELTSDLPNVNALVTHVSRFRGKMLRPTLVLLAGLAAADPQNTPDSALRTQDCLTDDHITLATVVEMVHMATLVHDDILDGAEIRRRGATINHLHGNEAAVLLGDYLISHAYHLCSSLDGWQGQAANRLIGHTTNTLCEGELTQNFHRNNWNLDEATYRLIIYRKTAALTEACCRLGAMFSTERTPWIDALATFGRQIGLAFQIVDDLLDILGQQKTVGKSLGTDIEKGKLTLPLIHFLHHAAPQHRDLLISLLESRSPDRVDRVRQLIAPSDSITAARREAQRLVDDAIAALAILPPSDAKDALTEAAHYVTARDN